MVYVQVYYQDFKKTFLKIWQVVVEINGIISSCQSDSCTFEYKSEDTPSVTSVSPTSGFGGESPCQSPVGVECNGCGDSQSDLKVFFGEVEATIETMSVNQITVCPGEISLSVAVILPYFAVNIPKWIFWELYLGVLEIFWYPSISVFLDFSLANYFPTF